MPETTTFSNASSEAISHRTLTSVPARPPVPSGVSGSGAKRVHSTTDPGSGSPDATPRVKGSAVIPWLAGTGGALVVVGPEVVFGSVERDGRLASEPPPLLHAPNTTTPVPAPTRPRNRRRSTRTRSASAPYRSSSSPLPGTTADPIGCHVRSRAPVALRFSSPGGPHDLSRGNHSATGDELDQPEHEASLRQR